MKHIPVLYLLLSLTGFAACKKTIAPPALSNSKILEYNVPVSDGNIAGVIDETDHTITVYIPFYYELNVIDPKVKLADGATLKETVEPVDVLSDKTTYTVTGADKTSTTYKLVIKIQQVNPLVLQESSTATQTAQYGLNTSMSIIGNFYTTDPNKLKVSLISKTTSKETDMDKGSDFSINPIEDIYSLSGLIIPPAIDTGLYYIKVKKSGISTQSKYPVRLKYLQPYIVVITAGTFKQGDTFTIKAGNSVFVNFTSFSVNIKGQEVEFPIVSYSRTEAVIKVPETLATGSYGTVAFTARFTGFNDFKQSMPLTINPK
ncbi:hypothetical protein HDF26_003778 [Pedobacter cryoconitis]|uniref:hypothetical protein n=1 Tax=Pedobacter cryoconitis TaxID=188932 RepID=UPI0016080998|nr:hypothetical protein [Pedobacter cryoconitis]MBB6273318.1 hypothetical protein [Pedobacter cryoconitis]